MKQQLDQILADDVAPLLLNSGEFYRQTEMLRKNYSKKIHKGIFDNELAIKGIANWVYMTTKEKWFQRDYCKIAINPLTRNEIARQILEDWMEELREAA